MSSCVGPVGFEAPQGEPFAKRVDGVHTMLPALETGLPLAFAPTIAIVVRNHFQGGKGQTCSKVLSV